VCGLAGFLSTSTAVPFAGWQHLLEEMGTAIRHRGPDDVGVWCDADAKIGLVHRRLSIVDLSAAGHQPMASSSGRYIMVFNGEIYNHLELRRELEAADTDGQITWRGHSDTETLLAGIEFWGIEKTLGKAVGMFAIALWDRKAGTLNLSRDRLGEKPLYYGWQGTTFLFGSELKALKRHPDFKGEIDRGALALQMRHNCIPAPYSIYKDIKKLLPGSLATISLAQRDPELVRYWDARQVLTTAMKNPFQGSGEEAVQQLEQVLSRSVRQQMVADVPLGAFLSGGIDSTTIVALMQAQSERPVRTFTIGFSEKGYNEAQYAKQVAQHLGTEHTELYLSSQQALDVIPKLPSLYCEPFSDSSQIPTYLVSQLARQHVTVSLSGDGGDELFGGYSRYFKALNWSKTLAKVPTKLSHVLSAVLRRMSPTALGLVLHPLGRLSGGKFNSADLGNKLEVIAGLLAQSSTSETDLYRYIASHWKNASELVLNSQEPPTVFTDQDLQPTGDSFLQRMMAIDLLTYLPDDILTKVDRAAMGVSLETRVPLLDHRVVEFAWSLPISYKVRNGQGKWPLRQVL
jgi:asparagine synthase (glutamine-hydrolysing)